MYTVGSRDIEEASLMLCVNCFKCYILGTSYSTRLALGNFV